MQRSPREFLHHRMKLSAASGFEIVGANFNDSIQGMASSKTDIQTILEQISYKPATKIAIGSACEGRRENYQNN